MTNELPQATQSEEAKELYHDPDEVVDRAKSDGLVIDFVGRVGARPLMAYTPYENHRGVKVNMWSCISYTFKRMPEKTLLSYPRIIEPDESDDFNVRMFTDEWVKGELRKSRGVDLVDRDETPFSRMLEWYDE